MHLKCPRCRAEFIARAGATAACPDCGHEFAPPKAHASHGDFQPVPSHEAVGHHAPRPKHKPRKRLTRERIAVGLAINVILPGVGTLMTGRQKEGLGQFLLLLLGLATIPVLIGLALVPAAWVWALLSSIQHLTEYDRSHAARPH